VRKPAEMSNRWSPRGDSLLQYRKDFHAANRIDHREHHLCDSFDLPESTVHIRREQLLAIDIFLDQFTFENFDLKPVDFTVELIFDSDFVAIFEVRAFARQPAIQVLTTFFHAALNFRDFRLPELFRGVHRREHDEPVHFRNPAAVALRRAVARLTHCRHASGIDRSRKGETRWRL
jgi:hypothetical protein